MSALPATVYIATISTHEETIAVADTPENAWHLATKSALRYLVDRGVTEFTTQQEVADYFSVDITAILLNSAAQK